MVRVTFSATIDHKIREEFRRICKQKGYVIGKKLEQLMLEFIRQEGGYHE